jgi:hypothetical protein
MYIKLRKWGANRDCSTALPIPYQSPENVYGDNYPGPKIPEYVRIPYAKQHEHTRRQTWRKMSQMGYKANKIRWPPNPVPSQKQGKTCTVVTCHM